MNLIKNISIYTFSNIGEKIFAFFILIILTNTLSTEKFGVISLAITYMGLFTCVFDMGFSSGIIRFFYVFEEKIKKRVFGLLFVIQSVFTLILSSLLIIIYITLKFFEEFGFFLFTILIIVSILMAFQKLGFAYLQIQEKAKKYAVAKQLIWLFDLIFLIYLLLLLRINVLNRFYCLLLTNLLVSILIFFFIKKIFYINLGKCVNKEGIKRFFKYTLPIVFLPLVSWLLMSTDRIMLAKLVDLKTVGIYGFSSGIVMKLAIISNSFFLAYTPIFLKKYKETTLVRKINSIFFTLFLAFIMIFLISAKLIVKVLFRNPEYYPGIDLFPIFSLWLIILIFYMFHSKALSYHYKTNIILLVTIISAFLNVLFNFLLIPKFGMYGAALATTLSMLIQMIITVIIVKRISYNMFYYYKIAIFIMLFISVVTLKMFNFENSNIIIYTLLLAYFVLMEIQFKIFSSIFQKVTKNFNK